MGLGGPEILFAMLAFSGTMPKYQNWIVPLIIAAVDGSSAVMIVFQLVHNAWGFSIKEMFLVYLIFPVSLAFCSFWILPLKIASAPSEGQFQRVNSSLNAVSDDDVLHRVNSSLNAVSDDDVRKNEAPYSPLHDLDDSQAGPMKRKWTTKSAVTSYRFLIVVIWSSWELTASYFYFTTVSDQLQWITGDSNFSDFGAFAFSILVPCGAIFAPIAKMLLSTSASITVFVLSVTALIGGVLSIIPYVKYLQLLTIVIVVFNRYLLFAAKPLIFDRMYGEIGATTLYGIALFFVSCTNYTNYGWVYLSKTTFNNSFTFCNLFLNIGGFISGLYFAWKLKEWAPPPSST